MARLVVVSGGLREPSSTRLLADRLAAAVRTELAGVGAPVSTTVVELRPLAHAVTDAMLTGHVSPDLQAGFDALRGADAVIAVTPAFNASFSGLFKSFFDVLPAETLAGVPVLMGATGGTERHSLVLEHALRPMFSYLHAVVAPTAVYAATSDFGGRDDPAGSLAQRVAAAAAGFARLVSGCGPRTLRDTWDDDLSAIRGLLGGAAD
jgi:FMN reductase